MRSAGPSWSVRGGAANGAGGPGRWNAITGYRLRPAGRIRSVTSSVCAGTVISNITGKYYLRARVNGGRLSRK